VFSGAALVAAARLKWDPTLYVAVRELAPQEYAAASVLIFAGALLTLLLAHLALGALAVPRRRRALRRFMLLLVNCCPFLRLNHFLYCTHNHNSNTHTKLMVHSRRSSRGISDILPRRSRFTKII
jgi:hypothetical protein